MLTNEQINTNRINFINMLSKITREGFKAQELVDFLDKSNFFTAPASTKYHGNYVGGLCEHSLKVFNTLLNLCNNFACFTYYEEADTPTENEEPIIKTQYLYSEENIILVSLFHELYKADFYTQYTRNKLDEASGNWVKVNEYKIKDSSERFTVGSRNFNTYLLLSKYIPLTEEETAAIINYSGGLDKAETPEDICMIFKKYNLATLLHCADMICTYNSTEEKKKEFIVSLYSGNNE